MRTEVRSFDLSNVTIRNVNSVPERGVAVLETQAVTDVESTELFDLDAFFDSDEADKTGSELKTQNQEKKSDLLVILRNDANESIVKLTRKINPKNFARGISMTSGVFSALGSVVGSCGVFCAHGFGSIAEAGSSGFKFPSFSGLSTPGFNIDKNGNFTLDGNISTLSKLTGISQRDLLSGKFSADDILLTFFSEFGSGMSLVFGIGFFELMCSDFFDAFLPRST